MPSSVRAPRNYVVALKCRVLCRSLPLTENRFSRLSSYNVFLMKTFPAAFLNVDLDIKSNSDPALIAKAWENRVIRMHAPKVGRQHWLRFALTFQPKTPTAAIRHFAKLVRGLPPRGRRAWAQAASKEFDVGIQAGFERRSGEWLLEPEIVQTIADLGARIRLTVYSPLLIIHEDATRKRARSRRIRRA